MRGLALGLVLLAPVQVLAECAPGTVEFPQAKARFSVEIADTTAERAQGLMNRPHLPASQGMLFVYQAPGHPQFWMKDTLIALDMLFLAPDGTILKVAPQAVPLDETPIDGGPGVQYVLEINGGLAEALRLSPGMAMRWEGLGPGAKLACP